QQIIVRMGDKQVFCKVVFLGGHTSGTHATTALGAVISQQRAFDIPLVGDSDHHFLVGDHVFGGDLVLTMDDLCPPVVAVPVAEFFQLILDDLHPHGLVGQDVLQARDKLLNL